MTDKDNKAIAAIVKAVQEDPRVQEVLARHQKEKGQLDHLQSLNYSVPHQVKELSEQLEALQSRIDEAVLDVEGQDTSEERQKAALIREDLERAKRLMKAVPARLREAERAESRTMRHLSALAENAVVKSPEWKAFSKELSDVLGRLACLTVNFPRGIVSALRQEGAQHGLNAVSFSPSLELRLRGELPQITNELHRLFDFFDTAYGRRPR